VGEVALDRAAVTNRVRAIWRFVSPSATSSATQNGQSRQHRDGQCAAGKLELVRDLGFEKCHVSADRCVVVSGLDND
jgi:hypothetical protein